MNPQKPGEWPAGLAGCLSMPQITVNQEPQPLPEPANVAALLERLGFDSRRVAVEVNRDLVPRAKHGVHALVSGDSVEIVTLVGGGAPESAAPADEPLAIGPFRFRSRLFTGTGKYATYDLMRDCLAASGCEVTTVAVRRERLIDAGRQPPRLPRPEALYDSAEHRRLLHRRGCDSARPAGPRTADQSRQPRRRLGQARMPGGHEDASSRPGRHPAGDRGTGQGRLSRSSSTPATIRSWHGGSKEPGAASVMPAGSPIGSGQGDSQSQQHSHHPRIPQRWRSRLSRHRRCGCRHGERRGLGHGTRLRRRAAEYRDRRRRGPIANGAGDAGSVRRRPARIPGRPHSAQVVCDGVQSDGRDG